MININRKFLIIFFSVATLLSAGGRIVYHDDTKLIIGCDDNRSSLIVHKDTEGYSYEGKYYMKINEIIDVGCP